MKKFTFILFLSLLITACQSKEEKIQEIIDAQLNASVPDYNFYELVQTKTDSLFSTPYLDDEVGNTLKNISEIEDDIHSYVKKYKRAEADYMSYKEASVLAEYRYKQNEEKKKMENALSKIEMLRAELVNNTNQLYLLLDKYKTPEFKGFFVAQRYRYFHSDFKDFVFIINPEMTACETAMSLHDFNIQFCRVKSQLETYKNITKEDAIEKIKTHNFLDDIYDEEFY